MPDTRIGTVGDILDAMPGSAARKPLPAIGAHAPGIYFGMPEDEYHEDPSLSASGIKDVHVSPLTFWMHSPFNAARTDDPSEAKERGKAFHARLLEGIDAFSERYAVAPQIADYPDAIDGGEALKARCKDLGLPVGGSIAKLCERIREADSSAVLWPEIMLNFQEEAVAAGKTIIKQRLADDIQRQARIVEMHPGTEKALRGGYCEVSIFYIDKETGVPMKARIDYLKVRAAVELKTFTNPFGKTVDAAVSGTVANNKYFVDAVVRLDAIEAAKAMLNKLGGKIVFGNPPSTEWLKAFAAPGPHTFVFMFLETGDVPNVRVREFKQREAARGDENLYWAKGHAMFRQAVTKYRECLEHYGTDTPWIDPQPIRPFLDADFPLWALD